MEKDTPIATVGVFIAIAIWLVVALVAGVAGLPQALRPPAPQVLIAALSIGVVTAGLTLPRLRAWMMTVDARVIVALHLTRFVGIYFLVLYGRGELPYAFAVPAGWGDIAVATTAIAVLALRPASHNRWLVYSAWNLLGFVDILMVVLSAARLGAADPTSMQALLRLPLSLLPTWLVPLIIATHMLLGYRLWHERREAAT